MKWSYSTMWAEGSGGSAKRDRMAGDERESPSISVGTNLCVYGMPAVGSLPAVGSYIRRNNAMSLVIACSRVLRIRDGTRTSVPAVPTGTASEPRGNNLKGCGLLPESQKRNVALWP